LRKKLLRVFATVSARAVIAPIEFDSHRIFPFYTGFIAYSGSIHSGCTSIASSDNRLKSIGDQAGAHSIDVNYDIFFAALQTVESLGKAELNFNDGTE
jgi:hypothetical protein